jgi:hypothetical protein
MRHPPALWPLPPKPPRDAVLVDAEDEPEVPLDVQPDERQLLEELDRRDRHLS